MPHGFDLATSPSLSPQKVKNHILELSGLSRAEPGPGCSLRARPGHSLAGAAGWRTPPAGLGATGAPTSSGTISLRSPLSEGAPVLQSCRRFFVIVVILLSPFWEPGV